MASIPSGLPAQLQPIAATANNQDPLKTEFKSRDIQLDAQRSDLHEFIKHIQGKRQPPTGKLILGRSDEL
jgi:hypothetical protein